MRGLAKNRVIEASEVSLVKCMKLLSMQRNVCVRQLLFCGNSRISRESPFFSFKLLYLHISLFSFFFSDFSSSSTALYHLRGCCCCYYSINARKCISRYSLLFIIHWYFKNGGKNISMRTLTQLTTSRFCAELKLTKKYKS